MRRSSCSILQYAHVLQNKCTKLQPTLLFVRLLIKTWHHYQQWNSTSQKEINNTDCIIQKNICIVYQYCSSLIHLRKHSVETITLRWKYPIFTLIQTFQYSSGLIQHVFSSIPHQLWCKGFSRQIFSWAISEKSRKTTLRTSSNWFWLLL